MNKSSIPVFKIMMIISQLLLSLFLCYWLFTQYSEKKDLLTEEITRGLRNTEEAVIDSMLMSDILHPIIYDSNNISAYSPDSILVRSYGGPITMEVGFDTLPEVVMQMSSDLDHGRLDQPHIISMIERVDTADTEFNQQLKSTITVKTIDDTSNQVLFQGVKLLINSVGSFGMGQGDIKTFFSSNIDTNLLKRLFNEYMTVHFSSFNHSWNTKGDTLDIHSSRGIEVIGNLHSNFHSVTITGYSSYLIKSIISQIIFAILLLTITALAFWMAFRNIKNQRKLITIKNDFISNITHELKTPVSTVKVALEALIDFNQKQDPKRTEEYLKMAHSEMDRLDSLVNNVLNNTALEEGSSFINKEQVDLMAITVDVVNSLQNSIESQNARVNIESKNDKAIIMADKLHIHGVIVNLLSNSLSYCSNSPEIKIHLEHNNKETRLSVIDNGIGIPDEYIDKVFDKFFRVPKGYEHKVKGYGLGLNYAQLVIVNHGGSIVASNNKNGGCTFSFILPNNNED